MERQTERLVRLVVALTPVEEVLLQVITDSEKTAAGCVGGGVDTIGARSTLRDSGCEEQTSVLNSLV